MSGDAWNALRSRVEELPSNAIFSTPLSQERFTVTEMRDSDLRIEYREDNKSDSLQREKLQRLFNSVMDAPNGFDYDRLPPNAEPYAAILSLHPHVHVDDCEGKITETEKSPESPLVKIEKEVSNSSENTDQPERGKAVSLGEMLSNMGTPQDKIECPITGCNYTDRSARSVAAHVSSSSTAKHIWANTSYAGWRDFVRKHE